VRVEADNGHTTIRLYSVDRVPSLSTILPALHNAGVAIDREQAHSLRVNGERHFVTSLSVDAASAAKLASRKSCRWRKNCSPPCSTTKPKMAA
jgi:glutamate dehydrogenase